MYINEFVSGHRWASELVSREPVSCEPVSAMFSAWVVSAVLLVVDVRTGALQQKEPATHRCFSCAHETACDAQSLSAVLCPAHTPVCATVAIAPNFTSSLSCTAAIKTPCSLVHSPDLGFQFTCVCLEDLCNVPFTVNLKNQLLEFLSTNITHNSSDYTEAFFKFANLTGDVYKEITVRAERASTPKPNVTVGMGQSLKMRALSHAMEVIMPRPEALKQEATAPSDDDEDDSEGSGAYEDTKSQRHPLSDPAAPSSFLPAQENKSVQLLANFLVASPILLYFLA